MFAHPTMTESRQALFMDVPVGLEVMQSSSEAREHQRIEANRAASSLRLHWPESSFCPL